MSDAAMQSQRFKELANRSYNNNHYTYTSFLSMAELSEYYEMERELAFACPKVFGGCEIAERKVVRFGNPDDIGYEDEFPIVSIVIKPLMSKFSDNLNHRDFLGALMNLGIKRETLGDIFVRDNQACLFCLESMSEYIVENLTRIKHTSVSAKIEEDVSDITAPVLQEKIIQVASERIDAVVAKVYNLSRQDSLEMFPKNLIFLNGKLCTENAKALKNEDVISVRGQGKFVFAEIINESKKGKSNCRILIYK